MQPALTFASLSRLARARHPVCPLLDLEDDAPAYKRAADIQRAVKRLDATLYPYEYYAYYDDATGCAYIVDGDALAKLGRAIHGRAGSILRWSYTTGAVEVDAHDLVNELPAEPDFAALRDAAYKTGDLVMLVALDLLGETLQALLDARYNANDEVPQAGHDVVNTRALH